MEERKIKAYAGSIPVYCTHDKIIQTEDLKPNPANPNTHPAEQIRLLARIIQDQGWRQPITVSTRSGYIVKGHGRYMAALKLGCPAPVDFQHYDSQERELADLIADNRIAELSKIDNAALEEALRQIADSNLDMELTGFSDFVFNQEVAEVVDKMTKAEEWKAAAVDKAEKAKERICTILDQLAEEAPEKLSNAVAVVLPKGRGSKKDCIIITDEACMDIVQELKRYADEGAPSPLEKLISQVINYAPNTKNY